MSDTLLGIADLLIEPSALRSPGGGSGSGGRSCDSWPPLGVLDLRACPADLELGALPPFPLVGVGDAVHPLARKLDAIVEPPISLQSLVRHIGRAPRAAALVVQLLRNLEGLPWDRGLAFESLCYGVLQGSEEHGRWLAGREARALRPSGRLIVDRQGPALHLVLDRPCAHNAIDRALRDQLVEALTVAALDPDVRAVTLRARGATFSVGGELEEFGTTRDPATAHLIRVRSLPALAIAACAAILEVHVQGACVGAGLEIAAFGARVTGARNAWFQLPELSMGLIPGAGGCVSVPRRIGRQRAALLILSGRRINAETALAWGLIDAIEDDHGEP